MTGRDRLGRGLDSLLDDFMDSGSETARPGLVPLSTIGTNPAQPRREFAEKDLEELRGSIEEHGLLQPLVVRKQPGASGRFQLIAGERRLRAVEALGWKEVPVVLREASDEALLVLALVENLQREELNPLEAAEGYHTLASRFGLSQEEIARNVGKSRPTITNSLRLLNLPPDIKEHVRAGRLAMGHARALLSLGREKAVELADLAAKEGWSVRETERRTKEKPRPMRSGRRVRRDPSYRVLEDALTERLGARVRISERDGGRGSVRIRYDDLRQLEHIFELVTGLRAESLLD